MVGHTPGPWTWEIVQQPYLGSETREQTLAANAGRKPGDPIVIGDTEEPGEIVILDTDGDYVASILSTLEEWDQAGRDARLIAAAPDLLAALERILTMCGDDDAHIHALAHIAIAKARGTS